MKHEYTDKRILLVSDDSSVREALGEMLRAADFDVRLAENGRKAVETLVETPVSVIVLDFRTRFDAKDVVAGKARTLIALTDVDPFLPLILTCEADTELDHETSLMADFIVRHPVQPSGLLDAIETLLEESLRERVYRKSAYLATVR